MDELLEPANPEAAAKVARIVEELGDCFWYLNQLASDLGLDLEEIARRNLRKLSERYRGQREDSGESGENSRIPELNKLNTRGRPRAREGPGR